MKTIDIIITPKDFIGNEYTDSFDCPLARAVRRTLNINKDLVVGVDIFNIYIKDKDNYKINEYINHGFDGYKFKEVKKLFEDNPEATYTTRITEI